MPLRPQPRRARGTVGHPYSALNLRLVLAGFGLVICTILAVLLFRADFAVPGWIVAALAALAAVNLVVVQLRRRARRRAGDTGHSLFE
jgi:uncharacterized membrane protein